MAAPGQWKITTVGRKNPSTDRCIIRCTLLCQFQTNQPGWMWHFRICLKCTLMHTCYFSINHHYRPAAIHTSISSTAAAAMCWPLAREIVTSIEFCVIELCLNSSTGKESVVECFHCFIGICNKHPTLRFTHTLRILDFGFCLTHFLQTYLQYILSFIFANEKFIKVHDGRPINKLQNGIILLIFKVWKIRDNIT